MDSMNRPRSVASDAEPRQFVRAIVDAPAVPKMLALAPTTVCLARKDADPRSILDVFIEFLHSDEIDATLLKECPDKFWVSANAFLEGKMVRVKAHIYKDDEVYLLEIQQHRGCPRIFNKVYRKVLSFLCQRFKLGPTRGMVEGELVAAPVSRRDSLPRLKEGFEFPALAVAVDVSPFVDTAMFTNVPSLQTVMFNCLAGISSKEALATDHFAGNVGQLMQKHNFPTDAEAEYAFADMLAQVAPCVEVSQKLAEHGVWRHVVDRICDENVSTVVKTKLRRALQEL